MSVQHIGSKEEFESAIRDSNYNATIVDFTATWCGPCQRIGPVFVKKSENYQTIKFIKVDVDELDDVAASCNVNAMPTFQVFQNGVQKQELVGASERDLQAMIEKFA